MLNLIKNPAVSIARGHQRLSCRNLRAQAEVAKRQDDLSWDCFARQGAFLARKSWPGQICTLTADVVFGTLRLSSHRYAMHGVFGVWTGLTPSRIYIDKIGLEEKNALSVPYPDKRHPKCCVIEPDLIMKVLMVPWVTLEEASGEKEKRLKARVVGRDKRIFAPIVLEARKLVDSLRLPQRFEQAGKSQHLPNLKPFFKVGQVGSALFSTGIACLFGAASLCVKSVVAATGALLGLCVCLTFRIFRQKSLQVDALLAANELKKLNYKRELPPDTTEEQLAACIGSDRFIAIGNIAQKLHSQAATQGIEHDTRASFENLVKLFRTWLDESLSPLSAREREALLYFFASEEGLYPDIWSDMQTKENRGRQIPDYLWQRFAECFARRKPTDWCKNLKEFSSTRQGSLLTQHDAAPLTNSV